MNADLKYLADELTRAKTGLRATLCFMGEIRGAGFLPSAYEARFDALAQAHDQTPFADAKDDERAAQAASDLDQALQQCAADHVPGAGNMVPPKETNNEE